MKNIVLYPNPVLETSCAVVTEFNAELKELVAEMFEVMYAAKGIGLAANQIGVSKRVAVIDVDGETKIVLVNPAIFATQGATEGREGCLSLPGIFVKHKERPVTTHIRYQDVEGNHHRMRGTWLLSRAINHEIDHLNGKLCIKYPDELLEERKILETTSHCSDPRT